MGTTAVRHYGWTTRHTHSLYRPIEYCSDFNDRIRARVLRGGDTHIRHTDLLLACPRAHWLHWRGQATAFVRNSLARNGNLDVTIIS